MITRPFIGRHPSRNKGALPSSQKLRKASLLRRACVFTLLVFLSFTALEAFHAWRAGHIESRCAVCQVAHHSPAIGATAVYLQQTREFKRLKPAAHFFAPVFFAVDAKSRSPPLA